MDHNPPRSRPASASGAAPAIRTLGADEIALYRSVRRELDEQLARATGLTAAAIVLALASVLSATFILGDAIARVVMMLSGALLVGSVLMAWRQRLAVMRRSARVRPLDLTPLDDARAQLLTEAARDDLAIRTYLRAWTQSGRNDSLLEEDFYRCVTARRARQAPAHAGARDLIEGYGATGDARANSVRGLRRAAND